MLVRLIAALVALSALTTCGRTATGFSGGRLDVVTAVFVAIAIGAAIGGVLRGRATPTAHPAVAAGPPEVVPRG